MEPWQQEEARQAKWDKIVKHLPVCGCCSRKIYPRGIFYKLKIKKEKVIVCEDCKTDMDESKQILEQEGVLI